jgi:CIC family chloride channel protein
MVVKPSRWLRDARRAELRALATRSKQVVFWAAVTGALTGLVVAGFDWLVADQLVDRLLGAPLWVIAVLPGAGLAISWIVRRSVRPAVSTSNADEYLRSFHDPSYSLRWRAYAARMVASIATLGLGGPMGLEGPSIYSGSTVGSAIQRRMPKTFRDADRRVLLVAGAAAGVAAIFKAPATGAVFALEVPYHDDLARRMLLPALVASATGYLSFVAVHGTDPLFAIDGSAGFSLRDLLGAVAVGVVAGLGARLFSWALRRAKRVAAGRHALAGVIGSAAALAAIFVAGRILTGESLTFGPGYPVVEWASTGEPSVWILVAILVLRCAGTAAAVAGGGVGGLFIPLVVAGAVTGSAIGTAVNAPDLLLFVVIGMAAFLGAGYRVPLAAVMFVAETTGRPAYIVPGLLAAVAAELMMGASSVTGYQRPSERAISRAVEAAT